MVCMKRCSKCHIEKPLSEFHKGNCRDGKRSWCRSCGSAYAKKYKEKNKERIQQYMREYNSDPELRKRKRGIHLRKTYGLTPEQWTEMLKEQHGSCAICGAETELFVDHCHETKQIRGLLCLQCNSGLGYFRDHIPTLHAAIWYLKGAAQ